MDLFEYSLEKKKKDNSPLAQRVRPETIDEFFSQEHIIYPNSPLMRLIKSDRIGSLILYGPPGTGKTTLARIISNSTNRVFEKLSAVTSGIKDIKEVVKNAKDNLNFYNKGTILFIDEIHRFNKSQQDALLPHVESGLITLIGATTENPFFEVNRALLSRTKIVELKHLSDEDIKKALLRAIDHRNGLKDYNVKIGEKELDLLARLSSGDLRNALTSLEVAVLSTRETDGEIILDENTIRDSFFLDNIGYDKGGDIHYDTISAFIKSLRGSDPDAALIYLAKMLEAGEDPKFIARRLIIFASEDIGNADPRALTVANDVFRAVEVVGLPECKLNLAQGVTYLSTAPKSNSSYKAIMEAISDVKANSELEIPPYLRDSHYSGAKDLGHGIGYKYPHDYKGGYVKQRYMPLNYDIKKYYRPENRGYERNILKFLEDKEEE
ncbi:replication-associated recombination protein A [Lagierella sp.]|uniref:replication-associated recombination protein A n=1 Tax=Lagierella sp. TaxID=2849657 RepID=UPI002610AEE9|nr:replication-associated recombination protein A [Lagierella sp.]